MGEKTRKNWNKNWMKLRTEYKKKAKLDQKWRISYKIPKGKRFKWKFIKDLEPEISQGNENKIKKQNDTKKEKKWLRRADGIEHKQNNDYEEESQNSGIKIRPK